MRSMPYVGVALSLERHAALFASQLYAPQAGCACTALKLMVADRLAESMIAHKLCNLSQQIKVESPRCMLYTSITTISSCTLKTKWRQLYRPGITSLVCRYGI